MRGASKEAPRFILGVPMRTAVSKKAEESGEFSVKELKDLWKKIKDKLIDSVDKITVTDFLRLTQLIREFEETDGPSSKVYAARWIENKITRSLTGR